MRTIQVVPHVGNTASGPSYSVVRLGQSLAQGGSETLLMSVHDGGIDRSPLFAHRVYPRSKLLSPLWGSPELYRALREEGRTADVVHSHGMWLLPNVYPGWAARALGKPLVISPRGTLSSWALQYSSVRKKMMWWIAQGSVVEQATCLHATAESEYSDIRSLELRQPVCVLPNGIDVPAASARDERRSDATKTLLFLSRLHPKKGLDVLLRAWAAVEPGLPNWRLRIVGPDNGGHEVEMKSLAGALKLARVHFAGPALGDARDREYQAADLFVLPTHSENFGLVVAEALANGTPVITTHGAPWEGLRDHCCGWWIPDDLDELVGAIRQACGLSPATLVEMGRRGRDWMVREYSWEAISQKMLRVYEWLVHGGPTPTWVRLD